MDAILEQFLTEARENLSYLDQHLGDIQDGDEETINALFRAAHTLKGGAGLVGFNPVKEITHAAEDILDAYRKNEIDFAPELVDTLYDAFDEVVELIDAAEEIGDVGIEADNEKITEIKEEIRSFLEKTDTKEEESITIPFNVDNSLALSHYFSFTQIANLASLSIPLRTPQLTAALLEDEKFLWLVEFDLEQDVMKLGNDPLYLFYLLGNEHIKQVAIKSVACDTIQEDPQEWLSYLVVAISGGVDHIEETFYNVLDDLRFAPLSIEKLFDNSHEEATDTSLFEEFKDEIIDIFTSANFTFLDEKLNAIVQILNPETKEGFVLTALQAILQHYKITSDGYKEIIAIALEKLSWVQEPQKEIVEEKSEAKPQKTADDKAISNALSILNAQLKALELSKDETLLGRTKLLLSNVLGFLNLDDGVVSATSSDELKQLIKEKITILNGENPEEPQKEDTKEQVVQKAESNEKKSENLGKPSQKREPVKKEASASSHISKTVKIEQYQIDELMDIVGELLVMKNALPYIAEQMTKDPAEYVRRELLGKYEEISRVTDRLQDRAMGMRLLPLSYIFGRYPKLVRDLSKKLNKKIRYEEDGGETKLDKTMIEKLADPMIHIIRNSLDHGLEDEEQRVEAGKDGTGVLKISAKSEGDKVFISIEDDGRGIDEQKVVMKALELGVVDPDAVDSMSQEEKLKLLFAPGLSTNDEITELSGRGVGTDAVKRTIEELGGDIHITSEIGVGTKTTFELPLSVALTNVFHVKMNSVNYAIDMDSVVETEKVVADEIKTAAHKPFIRMRGELIPLLFESVLLGKSEANSKEVSLVVVQNRDQKFGLVVDEFVGQLDVVQKPLTGAFAQHPFITGTSLLGNGEVLFVLDPKRLVR